jgi:hypothetical protein
MEAAISPETMASYLIISWGHNPEDRDSKLYVHDHLGIDEEMEYSTIN